MKILHRTENNRNKLRERMRKSVWQFMVNPFKFVKSIYTETSNRPDIAQSKKIIFNKHMVRIDAKKI